MIDYCYWILEYQQERRTCLTLWDRECARRGNSPKPWGGMTLYLLQWVETSWQSRKPVKMLWLPQILPYRVRGRNISDHGDERGVGYSLKVSSFHFSFICIAPVAWKPFILYCKVKTQQYCKENLDNQTAHYEQASGNSGKGKLPLTGSEFFTDSLSPILYLTKHLNSGSTLYRLMFWCFVPLSKPNQTLNQ